MRRALRWLTYLALASVAFGWLLRVELPTWTWSFDAGFSVPPSAGSLLLEALAYVSLGVGVVAVITVLAMVMRTRETARHAAVTRRR